ncbi:MAG: sialidase family protein, partial [Ilumatobacteraceae bacterium]
ILIDPVDPEHLVAADVQSGVIASSDGGRTCTPVGSDAAAWVSSADGLVTLYASGGPTPQRSHDGGDTWTPMSVPPGTTLVEASPAGTLYAGVHDGYAVTVWVSTDDGVTWNSP